MDLKAPLLNGALLLQYYNIRWRPGGTLSYFCNKSPVTPVFFRLKVRARPLDKIWVRGTSRLCTEMHGFRISLAKVARNDLFHVVVLIL